MVNAFQFSMVSCVDSESSGYDSSASNTDLSSSPSEGGASLPRPQSAPTPPNRGPPNTGRPDPGVEAERRALQCEQERLRREAEQLNTERRQLEEERARLLGGGVARSSPPTAPPTTAQSGSEESSGSVGSLAAALQLEIRRRKQKAAGGPASKPEQQTDAGPGNRKTPFITEKNEKHDMLIAEFKKAHKKMFTSSTDSSEEEADSAKNASKKILVDSLNNNTEPAVVPPGKDRPKAPPPPPVRSSATSSVFSPTGSSSSSESLPGRAGGAGVARLPGIPTPDYDSTPDRSPPPHRKLFTRHRAPAAKHIPPPTLETIKRAKSLTALNNPDPADQPDSRPGRHKPRAPAAPLRAADSLSDLRAGSGPPSLASRLSSLSTFQPEFSRRHPDSTGPLSSLEPADSLYSRQSGGPAQTTPATGRQFEFLPRPCDPARLPARQSGEEARLASQDYRTTVNKVASVVAGSSSGRAAHQAELARAVQRSKLSLTPDTEKQQQQRTFALKKCPAPMPPILRK